MTKIIVEGDIPTRLNPVMIGTYWYSRQAIIQANAWQQYTVVHVINTDTESYMNYPITIVIYACVATADAKRMNNLLHVRKSRSTSHAPDSYMFGNLHADIWGYICLYSCHLHSWGKPSLYMGDHARTKWISLSIFCLLGWKLKHLL